MKRTECGSSFVELLIVLTLLTLAGAGSVFGIRMLLEGPALGAQSREVLAVLSAADERAVGTGRPIELEVDRDTGTIWELTGAGASEHKTPLFQVSSGIRIARATFGVAGKASSRTMYYGNGVSSPGKIVLQDRRGRTCALNQSVRGYRHIECEG
ncbi:MAG: hypothetical protein U0136_11755 [Bdellovibrionota bacterium]